MKKITILIAGIISLAMLTGCKENTTVGIIGGDDGPTSVIVNEGSQTEETQKEEPKGNVEIANEYEDGSYETYTYDDNDNITHWHYYNADGTVNSYQTYEYDANGYNTKISSFSGSGTLTSYDTWVYNENGDITESCSYDADGTCYNRMVFEYDERGNCVKDIAYNDGVVSVYSVNTFSDDDKLMKDETYTGDDQLISTNEYEYDANGYLSKLTTSTPEGIASIGVFENDADGNVTSEKWYDGNGNELDYSTPQ